MKKQIIALALMTSALAPLSAADCEKNSDACSAGTKRSSPFLEASLSGSPAPAPDEKNRSSSVPAAAAAPAAASSPAPAAAGAVPAQQGGELSSPAWLVLVAGGVAGLYFYLGGGARKRERK